MREWTTQNTCLIRALLHASTICTQTKNKHTDPGMMTNVSNNQSLLSHTNAGPMPGVCMYMSECANAVWPLWGGYFQLFNLHFTMSVRNLRSMRKSHYQPIHISLPVPHAQLCDGAWTCVYVCTCCYGVVWCVCVWNPSSLQCLSK